MKNIFYRIISTTLVLWIALFPSLNAQESEIESSLAEMPADVYEKVAPLTVRITNNEDEPGSGVIIGIDTSSAGNIALILTACHVIVSNYEDAADPNEHWRLNTNIQLHISGEPLPLTAIVDTGLVDRANDIAVLKTYVPDRIDQAIQYNEDINPGQIVAAFGFPLTEDLTQTVGRIIREEGNYYVFDAKIAGGNSGGPLVDTEGNIVGMSSFVKGAKDEGFATNVNLIATLVNKWLEDKSHKKFWEPAGESIWIKMISNPWYIATESALIVGILLWKPWEVDNGPIPIDKIFGNPPDPPTEE